MRMSTLFAMPLLLILPSPAAQNAMYDGKPAFAEGTELGYYLWRDGDTWHVRWTTMGRMRTFAGSVSATGGKLKSLKRIDVESERKVLYPGRAPHVVVGPRGRVRGVRGGRAPVVATREQDHIKMDGNDRILFNARTDNDIDGFDFKVDDVERLQFNLGIDGRPARNLVEVGSNNEKPGQLPLVVMLK
jgi:hypothetical protein